MIATNQPFPLYFDDDGKPLDNGLLYFGEVNVDPETNPIPVYWDAAGTIPASQPIRTLNGYAVRNGSPAIVYTSVEYSLSVKNSQGVLLYYIANGALSNSASLLRSELASTVSASLGSGMVGFNPALTYPAGTIGNAVGELLEKDLPEFYAVEYGMKFDGNIANAAVNTTAWLAVMNAAYAAGGGTIIYPKGTAYVNQLTFTWNNIITIVQQGQGQYATILRKADATATPTMQLISPTSVLDINSKVCDLSIWGNTQFGNGLELVNVANLAVIRCAIRYAQVAIENKGSLVLWFEQLVVRDNFYGYRSRKANGVFCNAINVFGGSYNLQTQLAFDIGDSSGFNVNGAQVEFNGTSGDLNTGGIIIRDTCDDEIGFALINLSNVWNERSFGRAMVVENCAGLQLELNSCHFIAPQAGAAAVIGSIGSLVAINCQSPSPGDIFQTAAQRSVFIGGQYSTITDTATYKVRNGVSTSLINYGLYADNSSMFGGRTTLVPAHKFIGGVSPYTSGSIIAEFNDLTESGNGVQMYTTNGGNGNGGACSLRVGSSSVTSRSINAGGTINASGADYAEYETKREDCGSIAKGDIVGFDASGLLTDKWADAKTFGIKSTEPSIVGGDNWAREFPFEADGTMSPETKALYELKRAQVDRIGYSGKVPINIAADVGQYIIPSEAPGGGITAIAVTEPTFAQYRASVGQVRAIGEDGRPIVALKIA